MFRIIRSQYGRGLIAMRDDDVAAQSLGINLVSKKISIFCISAFFAGVAGALWAMCRPLSRGSSSTLP